MAGGLDSYAKLLLHCDGADASTTFTDSSASARTVSVFADAQIDTAQSVFGGASGYFDGAGDYLTVPTSTDFDFGTGQPWTVDFRIRRNGSQTDLSSIIHRGSKWIIWWSGNKIRLSNNSGGQIVITTTTLSDLTWYHIAVVSDGTNIKIYVNGNAEATSSSIASVDFTASGTAVTIAKDATFNYYIKGWIDELLQRLDVALETQEH